MILLYFNAMKCYYNNVLINWRNKGIMIIMSRKVLAILLMVMMVLGITACGSKDVGSNVAGTLTVGFDQNFPPMGFVGDDGEFTGFDLELAAEVAKRLDLKLELQPIAWDSKDMELSTKNIDCVWNGFTINGREDKYTWTDPYMSNNQVFVVKADSGIKTLADLKGKAVAVQADSSAEAALNDSKDLTDSFGEYIKASDYNTALMDLGAGAIDAVAMDEIVARYHIEKKGDSFAVLDETIAAEQYGVGFLLGNEKLRDSIQKTLEEMAKDGAMAKISDKWFGKDITTIGK
jgi:polar amino acid transport system substrate-binding protein